MKKTLALTLLVLAAASPAFAADKKAPDEKDIVVATANGEKIMLSEVKDMHAAAGQLSQLPLNNIYEPLLDNIISMHIAADAGRKEKLQKTPEFKRIMKNAEMQALANLYMTRHIKSEVTKEKLEDLYKKFVKDNPPQEEMKAAHILVKTEAEAEAIIKQLEKGEDFGALADEKSENKGLEGGDLGYFTRDLMVPEFSEAAFRLKEGEFSKKPVKTKFGWHIIKAGPRRLTEVPTFESMENELTTDLSTKTARKLMNDLTAKAKIVKTEVEIGKDGEVVVK